MSEDTPANLPVEDTEARAAELQRRLVELEAQSRDRLIRAELKAQAMHSGMVDLDGLKLVDASALTLDDAGDVHGAAALMQSLRRTKPWLFTGTSASSAATPPPAEPPRQRLATEMTTKEWLAARADLLRRR
jgi:hypothetical protein